MVTRKKISKKKEPVKKSLLKKLKQSKKCSRCASNKSKASKVRKLKALAETRLFASKRKKKR